MGASQVSKHLPPYLGTLAHCQSSLFITLSLHENLANTRTTICTVGFLIRAYLNNLSRPLIDGQYENVNAMSIQAQSMLITNKF